MTFESCIFIGPEHTGLSAQIIGRAIIDLEKSGVPLSKELDDWKKQMKRINEYADSLRNKDT